MRYSLLSRFQGGLLGSLMGESLVKREQPFSVWSQIGEQIAAALVRSGQIIGTRQQGSPSVIVEDDLRPDGLPPEALSTLATASSSEAALAILPLALFYHESRSLLTENLPAAISSRTTTTVRLVRHDLLLWETAISLALREQADPLLPRLLRLNFSLAEDANNVAQSSCPLIEQLEQVLWLLDHGVGLEASVNQLTRTPTPSSSLALAFYCFGATPEDFRLCVMRASHSGYRSQLTSALTGALAGAYNGLGGIPVSWRCSYPSLQECTRQATHLFSAWSGVHESHAALPAATAVAAPLVMQKRATLKLISQQNE